MQNSGISYVGHWSYHISHYQKAAGLLNLGWYNGPLKKKNILKDSDAVLQITMYVLNNQSTYSVESQMPQ